MSCDHDDHRRYHEYEPSWWLVGGIAAGLAVLGWGAGWAGVWLAGKLWS